MKTIAKVMVAIYLLSLFPAHAALAQEVKIGYVDTVKIFGEFSETIEAEEIYKNEVEAWRKKAEEMETELAQLREEIQSQSLMLSEEKLEEKKLLFQQKFGEYEQYMKDIFGEDGEAARRNKELTAPIVEKINSIIAQVAEDEGYAFVFDSGQGNLVYAKKTYDLTDMVIERLGQQIE